MGILINPHPTEPRVFVGSDKARYVLENDSPPRARWGIGPVSVEDAQVFALLHSMASRVLTQDNACTRDPVYVVMETRRVYGIDLSHGPNVAWVICHDEENTEVADEVKTKELHALERAGKSTDPWEELGYVDIEVPVTTYFTRDAAHAYAQNASHRHSGKLHVYVDSAHNNAELRAIRWLLEKMSDPEVTSKMSVALFPSDEARAISAERKARPTPRRHG